MRAGEDPGNTNPANITLRRSPTQALGRLVKLLGELKSAPKAANSGTKSNLAREKDDRCCGLSSGRNSRCHGRAGAEPLFAWCGPDRIARPRLLACRRLTGFFRRRAFSQFVALLPRALSPPRAWPTNECITSLRSGRGQGASLQTHRYWGWSRFPGQCRSAAIPFSSFTGNMRLLGAGKSRGMGHAGFQCFGVWFRCVPCCGRRNRGGKRRARPRRRRKPRSTGVLQGFSLLNFLPGPLVCD